MLEALGFVEKNGRWSNSTIKLPKEKSNTGEPELKQEKTPVCDQICPPVNELVTKYKISTDSEEQSKLRAAVEQEVARLEAVGEPVVPHVVAKMLGYKLSMVTATLRDMDWAQSGTIDDKSHMMTWKKIDSSEQNVAKVSV